MQLKRGLGLAASKTELPVDASMLLGLAILVTLSVGHVSTIIIIRFLRKQGGEFARNASYVHLDRTFLSYLRFCREHGRVPGLPFWLVLLTLCTAIGLWITLCRVNFPS